MTTIKNKYTLAFLCSAISLIYYLPAFAMEKLSKEESKEILNRIRQIQGVSQLGEHWFAGSSQTMGSCIMSHIQTIEEILNKHNIEQPKKKLMDG